jgi:hypothetical protein
MGLAYTQEKEINQDVTMRRWESLRVILEDAGHSKIQARTSRTQTKF